MPDNIANLDANGNIIESYYYNAINDCIQSYISILNYNPNKLTNNNLYAIAAHIYDHVFRPMKRQHHGENCNIPYTTDNISKLLNIYINIWLDYDCSPSLHCFERMTGICAEVVKQYVTTARLTILKVNQQYLINKLLDDGAIGHTVLANNEECYGLMYNRQNMLDKQTVSRNISLSDIRQIAQKSDET